MRTIEIAGVPITAEPKRVILEELEKRIQKNQKTFIITPYSEFIYSALYSREVKDALAKSDISLADGIGIFVAQNFLDTPFKTTNYYTKILEAKLQIISILLRALFKSSTLKKTIPEKIAGADFFWDLLALAERTNASVYFLGGFEDTPKKVVEIAQQKFPSLKIAGYSNTGPNDPESIASVKFTKPDILIVAYGPFVQERFIAVNLEELPVKVGIGVGGTFDYVSGVVRQPPSIIRTIGLEWLFRLFTQKGRAKRIWNATFGMLLALMRYKVFESLEFRKNVVTVIIKDEDVLVCKRKYKAEREFGVENFDHWQLPQGGLEKGESIEEAAYREAFEETGLKNLRLTMVSEEKYSYHWHNGRRPLFGNNYHYKGQSQDIAYLENQGNREDVKLDNREFVDYKWVHYTELKAVIHPDRRGSLEIILMELDELMEEKGLYKA